MSEPELFPKAPPTQAELLIFSKDRPAQLDLLLRSIVAFALPVYSRITVLYTFTGSAGYGDRYVQRRFAEGYNQCRDRFPGLRWQYEQEFDTDVWAWLEQSSGPAVSFLVDDCVFYRPAQCPPRLPWSFRGGDYDYPFSLDGNVYHRNDVLTLLDGLHFRNPTELEAFGHDHRARLPFTEVLHGEPCLVGIPANRVSVSSGMPHMGVDPAKWNRHYLAGERLQIPVINRATAPHEFIEMAFAPE